MCHRLRVRERNKSFYDCEDIFVFLLFIPSPSLFFSSSPPHALFRLNEWIFIFFSLLHFVLMPPFFFSFLIFSFASREGVSISQSVYRFSVSFCRLIKWIRGKGWEIFGSPIKRQLATNEKKKKMYCGGKWGANIAAAKVNTLRKPLRRSRRIKMENIQQYFLCSLWI